MKIWCDQGASTVEASPGQLLQGRLWFFQGEWTPAFQRKKRNRSYSSAPLLALTMSTNCPCQPSIALTQQFNPIAIAPSWIPHLWAMGYTALLSHPNRAFSR